MKNEELRMKNEELRIVGFRIFEFGLTPVFAAVAVVELRQFS